MRPKWFRIAPMLIPVVIATTGCAGINLQKSVSPLDFLLPGLTATPSTPSPGDGHVPATHPEHPVAMAD